MMHTRFAGHHHETRGRVVATASIDLSAATDGQLLAIAGDLAGLASVALVSRRLSAAR